MTDAAIDTDRPAQPAPGVRKATRRRNLGEALTAYGLLTPALFGVLAFLLVPIMLLIPLSFAEWDLLHPLEWVGLANWTDAFQNAAVWRSFGVTILFVILVMPLQIGFGLWLAVLLETVPGITG